MSERNTLVRSLHDVGLAAWFGGTLMGAAGLNRAASQAKDPAERLRLSSAGWALWTPWQIAAIGAHAVGGVGLIVANRKRLAVQPGAGSATTVKLVVTVAAAAASTYAGVLGAKLAEHQDEGTDGTTTPASGTSDELQASQKQLRIVQWAIPALTGIALVLGAVQGEQQRSVGGLADLSAGDLASAAKRAFSRAG